LSTGTEISRIAGRKYFPVIETSRFIVFSHG
jgi:hypothetical protein